MNELLLELFSEEIPANMQKIAANAYETIIKNFLTQKEISYQSIFSNFGPRRISLVVNGLPSKTKPIKVEIKGPKKSAPEKALQGFYKSNNTKKEDLVLSQINGVDYYFFQKEIHSRNIKEILEENLPKLIDSFVWPKSMHWGNYKMKWVRPLHNILCLFNEEVVNFEYGHIRTNNYTFAHRFMSQGQIEIRNFDDYKKKLKDNFVIIDQDARSEFIEKEIIKIANINNLKANINKKLLEEVTNLVEFPTVMIGSIKKEFCSLPKEVLITSMQQHQKYFSTIDNDGNFAPKFIFVSNNSPNNKDKIIKGNELVLSSRLADALYFYQQDLNKTIELQISSIKSVIFHTKLGSLYDKSLRLIELTKFLDPQNHELHKAASLCKNDIASEMVNEFPNLQGIMGYYYCKQLGYTEKLSNAIRLHYKPQGPQDACPKGDAALLSIADKIDNLTGLIIAGEEPSGSKDPYALRRQALGIIRLILENNLSIDISKLVEKAIANYKIKANNSEYNKILGFIEDRVLYYLKSDYPQKIIDAVLNLKQDGRLMVTYSKILTLSKLLDNNSKLVEIYQRAANILSNNLVELELNQNLFNTIYEKKLYEFIAENKQKLQHLLDQEKFEESCQILFSIHEPLNEFFDNVMVRVDDNKIANNRLALLKEVKCMFNQVANFDKL
ncbi:MAG TPA: glycine--tRNA ligase subunit beta [Candidatus Megaira endosymbiont of Nemacystus decipiens]|nr:glycine--tRNA ligase subunit beta [Candidatus Megaera endosymbiont of Nemacystus decipiens]